MLCSPLLRAARVISSQQLREEKIEWGERESKIPGHVTLLSSSGAAAAAAAAKKKKNVAAAGAAKVAAAAAAAATTTTTTTTWHNIQYTAPKSLTNYGWSLVSFSIQSVCVCLCSQEKIIQYGTIYTRPTTSAHKMLSCFWKMHKQEEANIKKLWMKKFRAHAAQ